MFLPTIAPLRGCSGAAFPRILKAAASRFAAKRELWDAAATEILAGIASGDENGRREHRPAITTGAEIMDEFSTAANPAHRPARPRPQSAHLAQVHELGGERGPVRSRDEALTLLEAQGDLTMRACTGLFFAKFPKCAPEGRTGGYRLFTAPGG